MRAQVCPGSEDIEGRLVRLMSEGPKAERLASTVQNHPQFSELLRRLREIISAYNSSLRSLYVPFSTLYANGPADDTMVNVSPSWG